MAWRSSHKEATAAAPRRPGKNAVLAAAQLAPGTKRWIASPITLIAAIAKQIDVKNAVAITYAWVFGSSLMAAEIEDSLWSSKRDLSSP